MVGHGPGGITLGVDVMNGHLNGDDAILTGTDSANSNLGCSLPKVSCYEAGLPPMKGPAVLTTTTASVLEVGILPGGGAGTDPRRNHVARPPATGFPGWVAAVEPTGPLPTGVPETRSLAAGFPEVMPVSLPAAPIPTGRGDWMTQHILTESPSD